MNPLDAGPTGVSFTLEELAEASGLTQRQLGELARYGLLVGHTVAGDTFYDGDALIVARTAAGFVRFGIEARHLRMYKVAAEREAGFMEQVVMPLLKQRNPTARQQAADNLGELAGLGEQLRSALLRGALRDLGLIRGRGAVVASAWVACSRGRRDGAGGHRAGASARTSRACSCARPRATAGCSRSSSAARRPPRSPSPSRRSRRRGR